MSEHDEHHRGERVDHRRHHVLQRIDPLQVVPQENGQDCDQEDAHRGAEVPAIDSGECHADSQAPPAGGMVSIPRQRRRQSRLHKDEDDREQDQRGHDAVENRFG